MPCDWSSVTIFVCTCMCSANVLYPFTGIRHMEAEQWICDLSYVFSFCLRVHKMQAFLLHYFCIKSLFRILENLMDKKQAELFEGSNNRKFPLNWDHERLRAGSQSQRKMWIKKKKNNSTISSHFLNLMWFTVAGRKWKLVTKEAIMMMRRWRSKATDWLWVHPHSHLVSFLDGNMMPVCVCVSVRVLVTGFAWRM